MKIKKENKGRRAKIVVLRAPPPFFISNVLIPPPLFLIITLAPHSFVWFIREFVFSKKRKQEKKIMMLQEKTV